MRLWKHKLFATIAWQVGKIRNAVAHHPMRELERRALMETCDYIADKMPSAIGLKSQEACLQYALQQVGDTPGPFLEFGVFRGDTIRLIGDVVGPARQVHGFDSFEGLPTDWLGYSYRASDFDVQGRLPKVRSNTTLHKGWFEETLPRWCATHADKVAFVNVDCDLYSSTVTILENLAPRFQTGTVIHFDEYINYPGWKNHEVKAWAECVATNKIAYTYLAYSRYGTVVRIDSIG